MLKIGATQVAQPLPGKPDRVQWQALAILPSGKRYTFDDIRVFGNSRLRSLRTEELPGAEPRIWLEPDPNAYVYGFIGTGADVECTPLQVPGMDISEATSEPVARELARIIRARVA